MSDIYFLAIINTSETGGCLTLIMF